jgi:hypothetical protein
MWVIVILNSDILSHLLGIIEANRLVLLCGAGLSIPPPSNLMSAVRVSQACYDKYQPIAVLPAAFRDDVDALAGHFHGRGEFRTVFLSLVPWGALVGEPNAGHAAVADFLICGVAAAALSANFDPLIEQWANARKIALRGALDGQEAVNFTDTPSPLLKFHGCLSRNREETLWTQGQLTDAAVTARVLSCTDWMRVHLPGKDLLVAGFWTDWGYLNSVLAAALNTQAFGSVTVVDPLDDATLQGKAPELWARLTMPGIQFQHIQASGDEVLEELRVGFSKVWGRRFFELARPLMEAEGKIFSPTTADTLDTLECEDLYNLRRDGEGVPYNRAARRKTPMAESGPAAFAHTLLVEAGATRDGARYTYTGRQVRIVHGSGQVLSTVRERYKEPPTLPEADIIVCAGALDPAVPGSLISTGTGKSMVRPAAGGRSRWLTLEQARAELGI